MALIVLSPSSLQSGRELPPPQHVRTVARIEPQARGWVYEILRVYSLIKSHYRRLPDFSAWLVAKAVIAESRRHEIDPMLILAVVKVESRFRADAVSPKGAVGLMQILPFVARSLAEDVGVSVEEIDAGLTDPVLNLRLGTHYLMELKEAFGDWRLALVAYNWGPSEIRRRLREREIVPGDYADMVIAERDFFNGLTPPLLVKWSQ